MASRTSGKGSQGTAGTAKPRAGRTTGAPKKAAPAKMAAAAAKKTAPKTPAKKAPAKKAAARPAPKAAPSPTGGVYRLVCALWLGLAHGVGALFRGIGRGAKGLDPAHRKDGTALLLLGLALIVAAGTWAQLRGPVGDLVEMLVTGAFGRLDLLVPILLGVMAVRLILHPEKPEANGRIVIGLSALVVGVLGQVHVACGSPARGDGIEGLQDAGGLIGWAASTPLVFTMGNVLAVPLLLLVTVFGLLVVTATPVNAIPQRLRQLGIMLGILPAPPQEYDFEDDERYDEQWREALPAGARRSSARRGPAPAEYDADLAEEEALTRRRRPRRAAAQPASASRAMKPMEPMDPVDFAAAAAAALDGAVLNGLPPSALVADLTQGVTTERPAAVPPAREGAGSVRPFPRWVRVPRPGPARRWRI
jgi:S-DNA-T family DNA segregation ATPase FtsK/SpoIIIE